METYAITGVSGSLGTALTHHLLALGHKVRGVCRNEHRLSVLESAIKPEHRGKFSGLLGDIRDRYRLWRAFDGCDYVIHAAALKGIPRCEYDPIETVKTNIEGTYNTANAVLDCGVRKAILVSSDKACAPCTLYGASKLVAERVWLASNRYCGKREGLFAAVRYGNVWGSNGSVIHVWKEQAQSGHLEVTSNEMTRFHIRLGEAVAFVLKALHEANPGELWVPKLPSYRLGDLAVAFAGENAGWKIIGRRAGEKLHESMISDNESSYAREENGHWVITPGVVQGKGGFEYTSGGNSRRLSREALRKELSKPF